MSATDASLEEADWDMDDTVVTEAEASLPGDDDVAGHDDKGAVPATEEAHVDNDDDDDDDDDNNDDDGVDNEPVVLPATTGAVTRRVPPSTQAASPAATASSAPSSGSGSGSGSGFGASASTAKSTSGQAGVCPMICSPGLGYMSRWMTWEDPAPGIAILTSAVALYSMHMQGWSMISVAMWVLIVGMALGGFVRLHNHFMDNSTHIRIPELNVVAVSNSIGTHLAAVLAALLTSALKAVEWKSPRASLLFLAHLWLFNAFSCILLSATVWVLSLFVLFLGPMAFSMVRPQVMPIYEASVKPLVNTFVAKAHTGVATLKDMSNTKQRILAAGAVVLVLLVWQLLSSFISLWGMLRFLFTTASIAAVVSQHATACGCPATAVPHAKKSI